jgi:monofunctional glycosyltransferase
MVVPRRRPAAEPAQEPGPIRRWLRRIVVGVLLVVVVLPPIVLVAYRWLPPPATPLMLMRVPLGVGLDYRWRQASEISPHLARAMIASEDNLFCQHKGFDVQALRSEIERALAGERPRGASTITQQLAKNLFLWPGRGFGRKILEAWYAPQLEFILGKERILELYLNIVELGPGIYGAEAASRRWFEKPASALTEREAARLAVILPRPLYWRPAGDWATQRSAVIQQRIGQLGPLLDCAPR